MIGHLHCHRDKAGVVQRAGILGQIAKERVAFLGVRRLVGDTPDDDIGAVMVATVLQLHHMLVLKQCLDYISYLGAGEGLRPRESPSLL